MKGRTFAVFTVYFIFAAALSLHAGPFSSDVGYKVKAEHLYNFARFVEWPDQAFKGPDDPVVIALLGREPLDDYLVQMSQEATIGGRTIRVRRFKTIDDLEPCHVLYVDESRKRSLADILYIIEDWPVLTVSNMKEFSERGGIIYLMDQEDEISFEINADAAEKAHIKISSKLLKLTQGIPSAH
jgi:hypothetical protein